MKIESENTPETDATPELVDALLRDAGRRGAWLVLKDDEDDARFVQAEESDGGFSLEWRASAAICTTVWKTFRKAVLRAVLFAAIAEAVWFFPLAAGAHC